ncbi:hypothetical protein BaRGS_00014436, partial [Batillaria attramentaria]
LFAWRDKDSHSDVNPDVADRAQHPGGDFSSTTGLETYYIDPKIRARVNYTDVLEDLGPISRLEYIRQTTPRPTAVPIAQAPLPPSDKSHFLHDGPHGIQWRDCAPTSSWVHMSNFNVSPSPLRLPGDGQVNLQGQVSHDIHENVVLDVIVYKQLLSKWSLMPCTVDLGTCRYADVCDFQQTLFKNGTCPSAFGTDKTCTCPFTINNGDSMDLVNRPISWPAIDPAYSWLETGDYYLKLMMYEKGGADVRMCFEFFLSIEKD